MRMSLSCNPFFHASTLYIRNIINSNREYAFTHSILYMQTSQAANLRPLNLFPHYEQTHCVYSTQFFDCSRILLYQKQHTTYSTQSAYSQTTYHYHECKKCISIWYTKRCCKQSIPLHPLALIKTNHWRGIDMGLWNRAPLLVVVVRVQQIILNCIHVAVGNT